MIPGVLLIIGLFSFSLILMGIGFYQWVFTNFDPVPPLILSAKMLILNIVRLIFVKRWDASKTKRLITKDFNRILNKKAKNSKILDSMLSNGSLVFLPYYEIAILHEISNLMESSDFSLVEMKKLVAKLNW